MKTISKNILTTCIDMYIIIAELKRKRFINSEGSIKNG